MATKNNNRSSGKKPVKGGSKKSFTDKKTGSRKDGAAGKSNERGTSFKKKSEFGDKETSSRFGKDKKFSSDKRKPSFDDRNKSTRFGTDKKFDGKKPVKDKPDYGKKKFEEDDRSNKFGKDKKSLSEKPFKKRNYEEDDGDTFAWKKTKVKEEDLFSFKDHDKSKKRFTQEKQKYTSLNKKKSTNQVKNDDGTIRLNKYLSNAGVSSRREADQLILSGVVKINGKVVTELGTKVLPTDKVSYGDQTLKRENNVYLLLNKPKDYITTSDDPQKRKTVMELIKGAVKERLYPVGRLDRNTTGLLLFTNDGEMATKLTHPKNNIRKVYHVVTDQNVSKEDMDKMRAGLELEDGFVLPDDIDFVGTGHNKKDIGVEIHSGKNRIVRRMFEHLGYKVIKLDRVMFAGLNKKDLPRGKWRILTPKEISFLKML